MKEMAMLAVIIVCVFLIIGFVDHADAAISEEAIKDAEVHYESEFDRIQAMLILACEIEEVENYKLCVAISRLETGNWQSAAFTNCHNWGGLMYKGSVMEFETEVEGMLAYIECFKTYEAKGLTTAEAMQSIYCPENDNWARLVNQIMKEVK